MSWAFTEFESKHRSAQAPGGRYIQGAQCIFHEGPHMNAGMNFTPNFSPNFTVAQDPRWAAVVARDPKADGAFFYAVATTGVYCRPSCAARRAKPENVKFYETAAAAENAGFRPCKRCKPEQGSRTAQRAATVTRACRIIEDSEDVPSLAALAERVGLSASHFHRLFKDVTGLTPKDYAAARREDRLRRGLRPGASVTTAIFDAGYNAGSRFYEKSNAVLGMTPRAYRAGGINTTIQFALGKASLGTVLVAQSGKGICAILIGDNAQDLTRDLKKRFARADLVAGDSAFARIVARVVAFVDAPRKGLDLPLDVRGTAFQKRVWKALRKIPAGKTASYTDVAKRIGAPGAVRAVASACAANSLAVAIPCHRVLRNDGGLAGYRWGVARKRALLKKETPKG